MEDPKIIAERIIANVEKVIIGKRGEVRLALIALLCQGHVLIEDVPGVGKTMLARSLATSTGCSFKRIQFTPDLLPSDVTRRLDLQPEARATSSSGPGRSSPRSCWPTRSTGRRRRRSRRCWRRWRSGR